MNRNRFTVRLTKRDKILQEFIGRQNDISFTCRIALHFLIAKTGVRDLSILKDEVEKNGIINIEKIIKKI